MDRPDRYQEVHDVFDRYAGELLAYLQGKLHDTEESQELLSEVLMKLYRHCEQLIEIDNMRAWLYRITHNTLMDYFREKQRRSRHPQLVCEEHEAEANIYRSLERLVPAMVAMLPVEYRHPVQWADLDGIPQKEIAERLNVSLSGAKSRIQRGRKRLKELFAECLWMESDQNGGLVSADIKPACKPLRHLIDNETPMLPEKNDACDCQTHSSKINTNAQKEGCCV